MIKKKKEREREREREREKKRNIKTKIKKLKKYQIDSTKMTLTLGSFLHLSRIIFLKKNRMQSIYISKKRKVVSFFFFLGYGTSILTKKE